MVHTPSPLALVKEGIMLARTMSRRSMVRVYPEKGDEILNFIIINQCDLKVFQIS